MGAHRTCRNSSSTTSTTRRARSPAVAASRRTSSPTSINKVGGGRKVRTGQHRDDAAVRRKMEALRRLIVPGHDGDRDDELLLRAAAGYIVRMQAQVRVMQLMVDVLEHGAQDD